MNDHPGIARRPWPADQIERWPIDRIVPYPRNVRLHSEDQVGKLAASLLAFGVTAPLLVDELGMLIYGHGRRMAAELLVKQGHLQFAVLPVVVARGWTEDEKATYRIADNQLALLSDWDMPALKAEILELQASNFDLALTGFGTLDLRRITANPAGEDPDADAPAPPVNPVSRRGDVWVCGAHRLMCGDCTSEDDVERLMHGERPHLMVTDPPYGVEYDPKWRDEKLPVRAIGVGRVQNDDRAGWQAAWRLFDGDVIYCWHADTRAIPVASSLIETGFVVRAQIVWCKATNIVGRGDYHYNHEACWYCVRKDKTGHWTGKRNQGTVWQIAYEPNDTGHGTQKPVECMRRPIENNSDPGDAVYDPFVGSGTTMIAAELAARRCLGMDIDPGYCDVAVQRWQRISGKVAVLERTGRSFAGEALERGAGQYCS